MKRMLVAAALIAAAMPASAYAAVVDWDFSLDTWFENAAFAPIVGASGTGTPSTARYDLSWGSSGSRSALAIRDQDGGFGDAGAPAEGSLQTGGSFASASRFYHDNRVIPLSSLALDDVTLQLDLELTATAADGGTEQLTLDLAPFLLSFRETPNQPPCESEVGQCADIFTLDTGTPLTGGVFSYAFEFDGGQYVLDLLVQGLAGLTDQQCAAAGAGSGCIGFVTSEDATSMTQLSLRIRTAVPEPAAVGLLGLGLLGLAGLRRRRSRHTR